MAKKNQLGQLKEGEPSFINRSILTATKALADEQDKRIRQAQDEIDGRIWSRISGRDAAINKIVDGIDEIIDNNIVINFIYIHA